MAGNLIRLFSHLVIVSIDVDLAVFEYDLQRIGIILVYTAEEGGLIDQLQPLNAAIIIGKPDCLHT